MMRIIILAALIVSGGACFSENLAVPPNSSNVSVNLYGKKYVIKESQKLTNGEESLNLSLVIEKKNISIASYLYEGTIVPKIDAISIYSGKDTIDRVIVLVQRSMNTDSNHSEFIGSAYQIYIYKAIKIGAHIGSVVEDINPMRNQRYGQVGKWEDGKKEVYRFTNIASIKQQLKKEGF